MIEILLFLPVVLSVTVLIARRNSLNIILTTGYALVFLAVSIILCFTPSSFTQYFRTDNLNIFFLLILAVVFFGVAVYNIDYLRQVDASGKRHDLFTANLLIFIASMTGVILSTHLALLWVFVEATTLSGSYLIFFSQSESSLEATWKYLFICSIGIAIAFAGIIILSMGLGNSNSLFFDDLYSGARNITPFWLKLAFPIMLTGFGTKVGFAPVHAWLPDAHSESPTPVSALLSGTLLNAALLGVIRIKRIMDLAGMGWYADNLLLVTGFISIFISAVYIINIKNYKRMLAYSSIENMGIIAICLGTGGAGLFAAMLHMASHSLVKASFFLTSGNILHRFRSKEIGNVRGLLRAEPATGWLWMLCFAAIVGIPPFPIFLSEFLAAKSMFDAGMFLQMVLFLFLLTINMAGIGKTVLRMSFGAPHDDKGAGHTGVLSYLPQFAFLAVLVVMGVSLPPFVQSLIRNAAALI